eukprot:886682_1
MGNDLAKAISCSSKENHTSTTNLRTKFSSSHSSLHRDDFIIEYSKTAEKTSHQMDIESIDTRRIVFVSVVGLYQTWKQCPSAVLYSALLVLPLKSEWIYRPSRYHDSLSPFFKVETAETNQFLDMLKWKESQGLVCWTLDDYASTKDTPRIHPSWHHLSDKLQSLYDPITAQKYHSIPLDTQYWTSEDYISKFGVTASDVVSEMCCSAVKFSLIQEMIHQSNPKTLVSMVSYSTNNEHKWNEPNDDLFDDDSENEGWLISDEYNPHEMSDEKLYESACEIMS